jgi:hypothetical protein
MGKERNPYLPKTHKTYKAIKADAHLLIKAKINPYLPKKKKSWNRKEELDA